ncbi:MAG: hypothetical protein Kow0010_12320 [Dehalococcoidia bacterium]
MVAIERRASRSVRYAMWPRRRLVRWMRRLVTGLVIIPALRMLYGLEVRGQERLDGNEGPFLVVCNHNMHMDSWIVLWSLPPHVRYNIGIAAAASDIFGNRLRGFLASFLGNAFPFTNAGAGVRQSLEHIAELLEEGESVLLYPEGKLTVCGPMQPFGNGASWVAVRTGVQVLPLRIDVLRPGFREGKWLPNPRARVRMNIGEPFRIAAGTSYEESTAIIERAVRTA